MSALFPSGAAVFSPCGLFRYRLDRDLGGTRVLAAALHNPSTADAEKNDPTLSKLIGYGRRWGFGRLVVVNPFAFRTPDPSELLKAHARGSDVVGPDCDRYIREAVYLVDASGGLFLCGWGKVHKRLQWRLDQVMTILTTYDAPRGGLWSLGTNADGSPKHPLYLKGDLKPEAWRA